MMNAKLATYTEIVLTTAELSYLLQMLNATQLWGGDSQPLFPPDAATNEAQLIQGLADLKAHGWLRPARDSQSSQERWDLDRNLTRVIATVADPEEVIVITRYPVPGLKEVICHYRSSDVIVEVTATTNRTYRLLILPTPTLLWQRVVAALALPETAEGGDATYRLSESVFVHLAQLATTAQTAETESQTAEIDPTLLSLYRILRGAQPYAEIDLGRVQDNQLINGYNLTFLAARERVWLLYYATDSTVVVQPATQAVVVERLQTYWAALTILSGEEH